MARRVKDLINDKPVVLPSDDNLKPIYEKPIFQTYYNRHHIDEGITFDLNSSLTDQDYKMQTDVNYLLEHMAGHSRTPIYGVQDNTTYEDWQNQMAIFKRRFMDLSPEKKAEFGTAQNFLNWCSNPANYEKELPLLKEIETKAKFEEDLILKEEEKQTKLAAKIAKAINTK